MKNRFLYVVLLTMSLVMLILLVAGCSSKEVIVNIEGITPGPPYTTLVLNVHLTPTSQTYPGKIYKVELFHEGESIAVGQVSWSKLPYDPPFNSYPAQTLSKTLYNDSKAYQDWVAIMKSNAEKPVSQRENIKWSDFVTVKVTRQD